MAEIIWSEPALADLDAIAAYVALDKPGAAKRLIRRVLARIDQLAMFPHSGGKPRELTGTPYRQVVHRPLRIFYRVDGERVFIVHVLRSERRFSLSKLAARDQ